MVGTWRVTDSGQQHSTTRERGQEDLGEASLPRKNAREWTEGGVPLKSPRKLALPGESVAELRRLHVRVSASFSFSTDSFY